MDTERSGRYAQPKRMEETVAPDNPTDAASARSRRLERAAEELGAAVRRQDGRETPVGPRALKTRSKLLDTAEKLFAAQGYLQVSLNDIAQQSGVSLGTVYQYFADRNDIVATLAGDSALRMLNRGADRWDAASGRIGLRRAIAALVTMYCENVRFFALWETASHVDERLAALRREFVSHFRRSFARMLKRGIDDGFVRSDLDPESMARAMTLMVTAYCYDILIFDPPSPPADPERIIDDLTALWADAVGLRELREMRSVRDT
jgi:AcrR family transcriptional regulator